MTYPTDALTAVCEMLLDEYDMTPEQIALLAQDVPAECEGILENRAEEAWLRANDPERIAARDEAVNRALIDAGRGHLVGR